MKRFVVLGAMFVAALVMASGASAATIYSQSNLLRGPDIGAPPCGGANHGKCIIAEIASVGVSPTANNDIKVTCTLKGGPANTSFQVFWTGTNVARGCHANATGFVSLGTLLTGATGSGKFVVTKGNNPFPGNYVHLDLCPGTTGGCTGGPLYTSVYAGIPIGTGPFAASEAGGAGDPNIK